MSMPWSKRLRAFRRALVLRLLGPPPLLWRLEGWRPVLLWRGVEAGQWPRTLRSWLALPPLLLQQLHWWSVRPLRQALWRRRLRRTRPTSTPPPAPLPRRLALAACWLNSFQPHEVRQWQAVGVDRWAALGTRLPDSHSGAFHSQRRLGWPQRCRPALGLLADKAALLEHTPPAWRSPCLALPPGDRSTAIPAWWNAALHGPGLVLKPLSGNACRGVVRFQCRQGQLQAEGLFRPLPPGAASDLPLAGAAGSITPRGLHSHWQELLGRVEAAIAMPYLRQAASLPPTDPAVVVRVITQRATPTAAPTVGHTWLEVPLPAGASEPGQQGPVAFIDLQGRLLPLAAGRLTEIQRQALEPWQALAARHPPELVACLEASIAMHQTLPPIDAVAWDWIPAAPHPLLLEGNSGFGMLVPQQWEHLDDRNAAGPHP
ncbi:MAG: hypothetical protein NT158_02960 [Cyanobacteria bacterium]|nr:hypothetical protein [Cyanobacteriota bacterium]